jgi:outer membrane protein assembly factor BamB
MSSPSHVQKVLPDDLVGKYTEKLRKYEQVAPAMHSGITVADGTMTFAYATGAIVNVPLTEEKKEIRAALNKMKAVTTARTAAMEAGRLFFHGWEIGSVTPTTTVARYAGRLLAGSADYKMHAVADNGAHIWGFQTEGRIYSSPAPRKDDVYFGSDDGRLYKVDVDSGILIWEFPTGGRVRSSPALDNRNVYVASWDGLLYAVNMNSGRLVWKAKIARNSSSSPVVSGAKVYIGDEDGKLHCFNAANGKPVWAKPPEIGGRISMCPVVTKDGIFVAGENGAAALVGTNGVIRWKRKLLPAARKPGQMPARITGQPLATKTQLIVPTARGVLVLKRLTGAVDPRFVAPTMAGPGGKKITMNREYCVSAVPYDKRLCIVINGTEYQGVLGRFIVANKAASLVWEIEVPAKKK